MKSVVLIYGFVAGRLREWTEAGVAARLTWRSEYCYGHRSAWVLSDVNGQKKYRAL